MRYIVLLVLCFLAVAGSELIERELARIHIPVRAFAIEVAAIFLCGLGFLFGTTFSLLLGILLLVQVAVVVWLYKKGEHF